MLDQSKVVMLLDFSLFNQDLTISHISMDSLLIQLMRSVMMILSFDQMMVIFKYSSLLAAIVLLSMRLIKQFLKQSHIELHSSRKMLPSALQKILLITISLTASASSVNLHQCQLTKSVTMMPPSPLIERPVIYSIIIITMNSTP